MSKLLTFDELQKLYELLDTFNDNVSYFANIPVEELKNNKEINQEYYDIFSSIFWFMAETFSRDEDALNTLYNVTEGE